MEWQRKARKALVSPELVYFLWLAKMATPRTGHLWPKCFVKSIIHILIIIFVVACCILSILSCKWQTALYCVWICILAKFSPGVLFASNFARTYIICHWKKLRAQETSAFLHKYMKPVQNFAQILGELILLKKKKTQRGLDLKNWKCTTAHFFLSGVLFAGVILLILYIFKLMPCWSGGQVTSACPR